MNCIKKIMLALMVAIVGISSANAQFRFGIKAGMNINKIHFSDVNKNLQPDNSCGWPSSPCPSSASASTPPFSTPE